MTLRMTDAHRYAIQKADEKVPQYELNTPEQDEWLAYFDKAFLEFFLLPEEEEAK